MAKESLLFEKTIKSVIFYLRLIGLSFVNQNDHRRRFFYIYNFFHLNTEVVCEIVWLIVHMTTTGIDFIEVTYIIPCLSLCFLGNVKALLFLYNMEHVKELIRILKESFKSRQSCHVHEKLLWKEFRNMNIIAKIILYINISGALGFAIIPWLIFATKYYSTGEIKLVLPFIVSYPFDYTDIRLYLFAYTHQLWTAWVAVLSVFSPDCFFYACSASITVLFRTLQYDIEMIEVKKFIRPNVTDKTLRADFGKVIHRHKLVIRCVALLEKICTISNLMNVVISSFLICATGFNILAMDSLPLMIPFISFLNQSTIQIFILCYYGDQIMRSSMELSNAIYRCKWYNSNAAAMKDFLFILIRTQKPCTITAYGFTIINLRAFMKILSTAWSYFALLTTLYRK
ncbi:hypothetical protein K1T71_005128 [Dendrolimus kikuchii]|uniref:Uncharacterized protein n=1 Tax=Dendrolimus kikuchii TaxID=765133 RepID=A0ACC1D639_9NEOP|nr:hypothetical protein K1T71_005128 [Dendrolimus kikuchii]